MGKRRRRPPPLFAWALAFISVIGSLLQAGDAAFDHRAEKVAWWILGSAFTLVLAFLVEGYKVLRER